MNNTQLAHQTVTTYVSMIADECLHGLSTKSEFHPDTIQYDWLRMDKMSKAALIDATLELHNLDLGYEDMGDIMAQSNSFISNIDNVKNTMHTVVQHSLQLQQFFTRG